ncbi:MAG: DDE-type integrase/transposase/recombinase [Ktedonobacteraceae bacterium]
MTAEDKRKAWAQFRFGVIAPLVCRRLDDAQSRQLKKEILNQTFVTPDEKEKRIAERTLREWIARYRLYGFDGLMRLKRSDRGVCTALSAELINQAYALRKDLPTRSVKGVLAHLRAKDIDVSNVAKTTLNRYLNALGARKEKVEGEKGVFQRWQKEHANDLWQADTSGGIWLPNPSNPKEHKQTRLISFIDDATRVCPHAEFYWDEQLPSLIDCFRKAMLKRGKPRVLLADNAFIYHSKAMRLACAQLGIESKFCKPYDPPGKGKIEKSYGTIKGSFYKEADGAGLRTLDELNKFWFAWLTREYHHAEHSALNKMTPIHRWKQDEDGGFIQRVSTEDIRRALMLREMRTAHLRTGTIRLNNRCYQLSPEFAGRKVEVLYEANKPCDTVEIWQDGRMVELGTEVVPGANIDFTRKRQQKRENNHATIASSRDYRLALVAAHQSESPQVEGSGHNEYISEPEFQALTARLLSRQLSEEDLSYLSRFFFENAPMTGRRTELLLAQVVNAKGTSLHLRSYCGHIKQGLNQQRS